MSTKSIGTEYEKYVERICKAINTYNNFTLIELKQNKVIKGISGVEHQIDIYWEFIYLGKIYKCIFECKNYKNKISKDKIATLDSISHDIPNSIPIIVSTKGFQSGAKEYAKAKNVTPYICRKLEDSDWNGCIKTIEIDLLILGNSNLQISFISDKKWCEEHNYINTDYTCCIDAILIDYERNKKILVKQFIDDWAKNKNDDFFENITFNDAYIKYDTKNIYFKLKSITLSLTYEKTNLNIKIDGDDFILGIITDVLVDSRAIITNEGQLKEWK